MENQNFEDTNRISPNPQHLLAMALSNEQLMDGTTVPVKKIMQENEVVFGVWMDATERDGVGLMIVKGQHLLARIAAGQTSVSVRANAIFCGEAERAYALKQVLGEREH